MRLISQPKVCLPRFCEAVPLKSPPLPQELGPSFVSLPLPLHDRSVFWDTNVSFKLGCQLQLSPYFLCTGNVFAHCTSILSYPNCTVSRSLLVPCLSFAEYSFTLPQCCGSGSGIRCLFDPGIRKIFSGSRIPDPKPVLFRA